MLGRERGEGKSFHRVLFDMVGILGRERGERKSFHRVLFDMAGIHVRLGRLHIHFPHPREHHGMASS
jgi:hypothetical protein